MTAAIAQRRHYNGLVPELVGTHDHHQGSDHLHEQVLMVRLNKTKRERKTKH